MDLFCLFYYYMSIHTNLNFFISPSFTKTTSQEQKIQPVNKIHIRSNQPAKIISTQSVQESIKHLKLKMGEIEKKMKKRPLETQRVTKEINKNARKDSIYHNKNSSFENYFEENPSSTTSQKNQANCYELLNKAGEMIKKWYHVSAKLNQYQQNYKEKCNNILNASMSNTSFLETSYSYSPSFKKKHKHNTSECWDTIIKGDLDSRKIQKNKKKINRTESQIFNISSNNLFNLQKVMNQETTIQQQPILKEDFQFLKLLGKGKFGQVYLGRHIHTGFLVAIKKVSKSVLVQYNMIQRFSKEIYIHSKLDHPNIVQLYGYYEEDDNICLVLEYLSGGTLFDFQSSKGTFSVKEAATFLRDIINALIYLHDQHIAHRDLKPENIVLSSTGMAKLCDFGWSTVVQEMRTTFCGTLDYAPPEILQQKQYDWSVDVWCLGILAYELLIGHAPFQFSDRQKKMQNIVNIDKTKLPGLSSIPQQAREFIEALLQKDPQERPLITELLDFPMFVDAGPRRHKHAYTSY